MIFFSDEVSKINFLAYCYVPRTGMEHSVVLGAQPWGLGLNETLLPQYLKGLGYKTHIIGKVHRAKGPFTLLRCR